MGNFYEKNIEALKRCQQDFVHPTAQIPLTEPITGTDGVLNLKCEKDGKTYYIHGENDVLATAQARASDIKLTGDGLIVAFGLGLGCETREIIKKMDKGTSLVIAEPNCGILPKALETADLTDIIEAPNVHFHMLGDKETTRQFFRKFISRTNYKNVAAFVLKPYTELFFEDMRELLFTLDEIRGSFETSESAALRFSTLWQKNAALNMRFNTESLLVSDFFGKFDGWPAIIVSAGPSLSKNIKGLSGLSDKCVIISVDTALSPLLAAGITPHFVVSMDGQEIVAKKFKDISCAHIPLIYIPVSSSTVVSSHGGTKLLSPVQDGFYQKLLRDVGKDTAGLDMGGSVATGAFSFAQKTGAVPIILVGQDLAYTGNKTHAEGTAFVKDASLHGRTDVFTVPSYDGGTVATDNVLRTYMTWFEAYAASGGKDGGTYINATEGGANLRGFINMSLKDVSDKYLRRTGANTIVSDTLKEAPALTHSQKKYIRTRYKSAAAFIASIKEPAREAARQLSRIYGLLSEKTPDYTAINAAYAKIAPFEKKISSQADNLEVIGIAIAPLAEKLNIEFENSRFNSDLDRRRFAASRYAEYYGKIADISEELSDTLNGVFN